MEEKVLKGKKNGMFVLFSVIIAYVLAVISCIVGSMLLEESRGNAGMAGAKSGLKVGTIPG